MSNIIPNHWACEKPPKTLAPRWTIWMIQDSTASVMSDLKPMTLVGTVSLFWACLVKFHDLPSLPQFLEVSMFRIFDWGQFRTLSYFRCNDRSGATLWDLETGKIQCSSLKIYCIFFQHWDLICNLPDVDGVMLCKVRIEYLVSHHFDRRFSKQYICIRICTRII